MEKRELAEFVERHQYFETVETPSPEQDEGKREMEPLYPFLISGGTNTERYYFTHINDTTDYHFNIRPKYFGDESNYTKTFPKRIKEILDTNSDAKIFCVFDWDTIRGHKKNLAKHNTFINQFNDEINSETIVLCPTMPSIEYWFLLHFENYTNLIKSCGKKLQALLTPHMKQFFPNTEKKLLNLLKSEDTINDSAWVENLCANGKLDTAIERAKTNIEKAEEDGTLEEQSYSYVYKIFMLRLQLTTMQLKHK